MATHASNGTPQGKRDLTSGEESGKEFLQGRLVATTRGRDLAIGEKGQMSFSAEKGGRGRHWRGKPNGVSLTAADIKYQGETVFGVVPGAGAEKPKLDALHGPRGMGCLKVVGPF